MEVAFLCMLYKTETTYTHMLTHTHTVHKHHLCTLDSAETEQRVTSPCKT